jgi:OOP family OmpA-OmpF porin
LRSLSFGLTFVALALLGNSPPPQPIIDIGPIVVFFDAGDTRIDVKGQRVLSNFILAWRRVSLEGAIVVGHSDRVGSEAYNLRLSCARARAVREYLIARGLPKERIWLAGRGEAEPLVETADGVAEEQNRFAEVVFMGTGEEPGPDLC